jgi:leader peptidase (prepilin peptidase) / N-methyltransferase
VSVAATTTHIGGLAIAAVAAAAVGALIGGELVERGLAQLEVTGSTAIKRVGRVTGALGGIAAALAAWQAGSWWLLPALLIWAYVLAAAATCDAATQRIPTPLVRQGALAVAVVVVLASAAAGQWRWAALAAVSASAAGVILTVCWRFAGAGFGDVRLAVLGGLGLVHPTHLGLVVAVAAFTLITVTQATVTLARGGNRHTTFPYGPAIAAAFVLAAVV